jgi:hypothetical protein
MRDHNCLINNNICIRAYENNMYTEFPHIFLISHLTDMHTSKIHS